MPYFSVKRIIGDEIRGISQFIQEFTLSTPTLPAGKINAYHLAHPQWSTLDFSIACRFNSGGIFSIA
jgi:hypothetical protein